MISVAQFVQDTVAGPPGNLVPVEIITIVLLLALRIAKDMSLGASREETRWFARLVDISALPLLIVLLGVFVFRLA